MIAYEIIIIIQLPLSVFLHNLISIYNNKKVLSKNTKGQKIIKYLFAYICKNPKKFIENQKIDKDKFRTVSDFISGMTDRYAINLYNNLK